MFLIFITLLGCTILNCLLRDEILHLKGNTQLIVCYVIYQICLAMLYTRVLITNIPNSMYILMISKKRR